MNNDYCTCRSLMNNCSKKQLTSKSSSFMNSNHRRVQFFNGVTKRRRPKALSSSASGHSHGSQKQRRPSRPHIDLGLQILDLSSMMDKQVLYIVPHAPPSTPLRSNSSTPTTLNSFVNFNSSSPSASMSSPSNHHTNHTNHTTTTTNNNNSLTNITIQNTIANGNTLNDTTASTHASTTHTTHNNTTSTCAHIHTSNGMISFNNNESSPISFNLMYESDTMAPLNNNEFIIDNYNRIDPKPELNSRLSDQSSTISSNSQLDSPLSDITEWNLDMSGSMFDILFIETDF